MKVEADRTELVASDIDLSFVMISLEDEQGNLYNNADRKVAVQVEGPGILQGFGSADPKSAENFLDTEHTTFDGKALAVVRPMDAGLITMTVSGGFCFEKCADQPIKEFLISTWEVIANVRDPCEESDRREAKTVGRVDNCKRMNENITGKITIEGTTGSPDDT
ncbi:hypothetical protein [Paenibacillus sp. FSL H7-0326]|uniref:hypothetical protein n=1 Tax=Paenibacillus sp. FSL H7-0326 TaxID=1921144 RepID=UPI0015C326D9|nr:hypothetical protein [Paenibacillus sp. FSL H7-0326]